MRQFFKSSFLWQFAGGFMIGAAGLCAFQPVQAAPGFAAPVAAMSAAR